MKFMWKMFLSFKKYGRGIVNMSYWNRIFCQRLIGLNSFLEKGTEVHTTNCSLMREPFIECSQPLTTTASGHN